MKKTKQTANRDFLHKWFPRKPENSSGDEKEHQNIRFLLVVPLMVLFFTLFSTPVFAADDPLTTINNMSDFIFAAIKAIGYILLGFGVVQIGMSLKSHDASQRATGFMSFAGGLIIAFAKPILDMILA